MSRPSDNHKSLAADLASLMPITDENKQQVFDLLKQLGYENLPEMKQDSFDESGFENHIGIYKPETKNGAVHYTRDVALKGRWSYFADVQSIPPKSDKKRIVLLGESVTRGFLLDPEYTPALVLDQLLNSQQEEQYEVIDLAETNLGMIGIRERFARCTALQPDLVIFFAGNNWREDLLISIANDPEKQEKIKALTDDVKGIANVKPQVETYFKEIVSDFITEVGGISKEHDFNVLFAIPEFNLLDCRSTPKERVISELPVAQLSAWIQAKENAEQHIKAKTFSEAELYAQKMIDIDPSHPYGFELLADCKIHNEDYDAARIYFETARDTALFCRTNSKPRVFKVIQNTINEEAPAQNITVVDLPKVFENHLNGKVPGRDMFLDYCHLSVEGIQVAMEAIYTQVLGIFNDTRSVHKEVTSIRPSREVLALGHLFAAIHNAHWGQSYEILLHHCTAALANHKEIAKTMVYYCDMISRNASNHVCKSLEKILEDNNKLDRYVHALIPGKDMKNMELELVDAMTTVLQANGVNIKEYLTNLRIEEHGIKNGTVDLLQPYYHATSYDEYQGTKTAFLQARDVSSEFFVVAESSNKAQLKISLRTPGMESGMIQSATISINDTVIRVVDVANNWNTYELDIPNNNLKDGVNVIKVLWPVVENYYQAQPNDNGSLSILDAAYRVFGEVCNMTVTTI